MLVSLIAKGGAVGYVQLCVDVAMADGTIVVEEVLCHVFIEDVNIEKTC